MNIDEIEALYKELKNLRKVQDVTGIPKKRLSKMLKDSGALKERPKLSDDEILDAYDRHGNYADAGTSLGVAPHVIGRVVRMYGRGPGPGNCRPSETTRRIAFPIDELISRYQAGESAISIANDLGVHNSTIAYHLKKHGIELRQNSGQFPAGENHTAWKGAKPYRYKGRVARKAVEQYLGRKLPAGWVVHHLDEHPPNNEPTNLWIFETQKEHSSCHRRLEIRRRADPEVSPILLARESGGLWLPEFRALIQAEPDTDLLDLLRRQTPVPARQAS